MNVADAPELNFDKILQEREKAWQILFPEGIIEWIPKSQARILDNRLYIADWLVKEKRLEDFIIQE